MKRLCIAPAKDNHLGIKRGAFSIVSLSGAARRKLRAGQVRVNLLHLGHGLDVPVKSLS